MMKMDFLERNHSIKAFVILNEVKNLHKPSFLGGFKKAPAIFDASRRNLVFVVPSLRSG